MATGDNDRFVRFWYEVPFLSCGLSLSRDEAAKSGKKWFPYANGGGLRKWYGSHFFMVDWKDDGNVLRTAKHDSGRIGAHNFNLELICREGLTWSSISSAYFGVRLLPQGFLFSSASNSAFTTGDNSLPLMGFLNSTVAFYLSRCINPTLNANPGDTCKLPFALADVEKQQVTLYVREAIEVARRDWDAFEVSWDFKCHPFRHEGLHCNTV